MNTDGPLESQDREVEKLFFRIARATDSETKTRLFEELTQQLVAYAASEDETPSLRVPLDHRQDRALIDGISIEPAASPASLWPLRRVTS